MRLGRGCVAIVFALSCLSAAAAVAQTIGPEQTIRKNVDEVFVVLKDQALAGKDRRAPRLAALRKIADRVFDWSEMARSCLGVQWRRLDANQRGRFVEVFKDVLAAEYMDDIDRFEGTEVVTVDRSVRQDQEVVVFTTLITGSRDRIPFDYRLRVAQGQWMIVDLSIEGVSLVNHFRKTFSSALANMTIDELIEKLKRQLPRAVKSGPP